MKRRILSMLLILALMIGIIPNASFAETPSSGASQTGERGTFIDGNQVITDMINNSGKGVHPRLIMTADRFSELKKHKDDNTITGYLLRDLKSQSEIYYKKEVSTYKLTDDHLLETSKEIQRRVATLALAYNIFDDEKYAIRAYKELEAACSFPDWSPVHFLDTAEMCTAFAYGYDWLYEWLGKDRRKILRDNMIEKGLNQIMNDYTDKVNGDTRTYTWYQDYRKDKGDNWQLVCTGGTNLAALAIGDEDGAKDIASQVLTYGYERAYDFVRRAYSVKDGTYIEGLGYWDYATYYLGLQSSALKSATGTDYGLADHEGLRKSAEFVRYMSSNIPKSFSFGDDGDARETDWAVFLWLGDQLNAPELSVMRLNRISKIKLGPGKGYSFNHLDVLWIDESKQTETGSGNTYPTDWGAVGACNASFRDTWDTSGLVAALHVGENDYKYHGHFDLGSFYIESNGSRFFTDLGNENYKLAHRDISYRIKPEGHNTLVINPKAGTDQPDHIECLITKYSGGGNEVYAISDLTNAYSENGAKSVTRGLKMIKDKKCVVIQDEITLNTAGEIYWFAHSSRDINVASDGRSAIITVGSDRLWVGLMSDGGKFEVMEAKPLTSYTVAGTSNDSYRKLAIHLTNTKSATISVACIPLTSGQTKPTWTPTVKTLSEWESHTHKWDAGTVTTAATCTKKGVKTYKCTVTGCTGTKTAEVAIDANNHVTTEVVGKKTATCTVKGYTGDTRCKDCGVTITKGTDISATGHKWDSGRVTKEPTVTEEGTKTFKCTNSGCTETKSEIIPKVESTDPGEKDPEEENPGDNSGTGDVDQPGTGDVDKPGTGSGNEDKNPDENIPGGSENNQPAEGEVNQPGTSENNQPDVNVEQPTTDIGTVDSSESKYEKDSDGTKYLVLSKMKKSDLKKNVSVSDKKSQGKYKISKITKKNGKVVGGTVIYMKPYNKNCKTANIKSAIKMAGVTFKVTSINKNAFKNCKKLKKVTIGKNIKKIGLNAFYGCKNLKTVTIKTSKLTKKTVGKNAFAKINKKAKIKVPKKKVTSYRKILKSRGVKSKSQKINK